jgi:hypothetical protein
MITVMSWKILAAHVKAQQKRMLKFKIQWYGCELVGDNRVPLGKN